jgi:hypothetical protein
VEARKTAFPVIVYHLGTSIFHPKLAHSKTEWPYPPPNLPILTLLFHAILNMSFSVSKSLKEGKYLWLSVIGYRLSVVGCRLSVV